jgi:hypothetical protein
MTGIILLTLTKQVTPEGYQGWMTSRLRSFAGSLGISTDYLCWSADQHPKQECLTALTLQPLRAAGAFKFLLISNAGDIEIFQDSIMLYKYYVGVIL